MFVLIALWLELSFGLTCAGDTSFTGTKKNVKHPLQYSLTDLLKPKHRNLQNCVFNLSFSPEHEKQLETQMLVI